jgi:hypothetical protein
MAPHPVNAVDRTGPKRGPPGLIDRKRSISRRKIPSSA